MTELARTARSDRGQHAEWPSERGLTQAVSRLLLLVAGEEVAGRVEKGLAGTASERRWPGLLIWACASLARLAIVGSTSTYCLVSRSS